VPYVKGSSGRVPNRVQEAAPWRIHEIVPDFILEDVWALPVEGGAEEFPAMLDLLSRQDPAHADSRAARALWQLRDLLGERFGLGRISVPASGDGAAGPPIPGTRESSLVGRLPADLRGSAAGFEFGSLPFRPLYLTPTEAAAEISNRTVHGVAHLAWVDRGEGRHQGQMAVYVKPHGRLGRAYMGLIKPFRYLVVYPALLGQLGRAWERRPGAPSVAEPRTEATRAPDRR
jgi:hypothetical protein